MEWSKFEKAKRLAVEIDRLNRDIQNYSDLKDNVEIMVIAVDKEFKQVINELTSPWESPSPIYLTGEIKDFLSDSLKSKLQELRNTKREEFEKL